MIQRNGKFYQRRYQQDSDGKEKNVFELEITFVIGSGNHARTYLNLSEGGVLTQLPVSWYSQEERWAMSPGYDHSHHDDFARKILEVCVDIQVRANVAAIYGYQIIASFNFQARLGERRARSLRPVFARINLSDAIVVAARREWGGRPRPRRRRRRALAAGWRGRST